MHLWGDAWHRRGNKTSSVPITSPARKLAQQLVDSTSYLRRENTSHGVRAPSTSRTPFLIPPSGLRGSSVPLVKPDLLSHTLDPTEDPTFLHLYSLSLHCFFNFALLLVPSSTYIYTEICSALKKYEKHIHTYAPTHPSLIWDFPPLFQAY